MPFAHPIRRRQRRACLRPPTRSPVSSGCFTRARPAASAWTGTPARRSRPAAQAHSAANVRRRHPRPEQHRQDLRQTPGRRLRKPVARRRLAAVAALQPRTALQRRYPLDKTRPLLPKRRVPCLQARNLLLQTPRYRHRQRLSLRAAPAHVPVHPCSRHIANPQTIESIPGSHAMSCFVCVRRISCGCFGHSASFRAGRARYSVRLSRPGVFGMEPSFQRRFVPSAPPPAPGAAEPFSARIARARACAWPCAYRGGANRAPDCARARRRERRAHISRPFPKGFFAPARNRKQSGPADAPFFLPHPITDLQESSGSRNYFKRRPPAATARIRARQR